jgi:branched-chain amino acid transport system permease protein
VSVETSESLSTRIFTGLKSPPGIAIAATFVAAVVGAIDKGSYVLVNAIVTGGMWALVAMGLALIFGVMNIVSFVHGEFFMIGGLVAYFVFAPFTDYLMGSPNPVFAALAPPMAMFTAVAAGAIVGILCELIVFRPLRRRTREQWVMNSFVITLGLSTFIVNSTQLVFGTDFRGIVSYWSYPTISFFDVYVSFDRFFVFVLALVVMAGFWRFMKSSKIGRAIRAVSQDEIGARMVGINIDGIRTLTLALSCGLAALAGACLLFMYPAYPTVGLGPLYNSWFIVILAGMGNVAGAAVGAFIVALFQVLTTVYVGEGWDYAVPAAFIVAILVFRPSGIFGTEVRGILNQ